MDTDKSPTETNHKTQSSCELCQRRKVRCDKGNPCSTCRRAGVKCEVSIRRRLPRGRNGGRRKGDTDLKARIAKLENLVSTLGGDTSPTTSFPAVEPERKGSDGLQREPSGDMSRYLGSSFWSNLSNEVSATLRIIMKGLPSQIHRSANESPVSQVNGLREVLDDSSESESETPERSEPTSTPPGTVSQGFNFVLCGPDNWLLAPNALESPPRHMIETLHDLYFQNVDPMFKVLHAPSVTDFVLRGKPYLNYRPGDPAIEALSFAIYYAGLNSLDAPNCKQRFGEEKTELLKRYRFALEVYLARADFINTTDLAVVQAFVIFLVSISELLILILAHFSGIR